MWQHHWTNTSTKFYLIEGADMSAIRKSLPTHSGCCGHIWKTSFRKNVFNSTSWNRHDKWLKPVYIECPVKPFIFSSFAWQNQNSPIFPHLVCKNSYVLPGFSVSVGTLRSFRGGRGCTHQPDQNYDGDADYSHRTGMWIQPPNVRPTVNRK